MTTRAERLGHTPASPRRVVAEVAVFSAALGVLMGVVWELLAPEVAGTVVDGELGVAGPAAVKLFDREAVFALLAAGCGLVAAAVFAFRHPRRPVATLTSLAVFGLGGSLLALAVGRLLGPDGDVSGLAEGDHAAVSLRLDATAALLLWPMTATVVIGLVALFSQERPQLTDDG